MGKSIVIGKGKYALISSVDHENSMAVVHRKLSYFLNNVKHALFMFLNISVTIRRQQHSKWLSAYPLFVYAGPSC